MSRLGQLASYLKVNTQTNVSAITICSISHHNNQTEGRAGETEGVTLIIKKSRRIDLPCPVRTLFYVLVSNNGTFTPCIKYSPHTKLFCVFNGIR